MTKKYFYVYIITNFTDTVLYTGVTHNLIKRVYQHKQKLVSSFSSRYNLTKLVYYEIFNSALEAITREKQLKAGSRAKRLRLLNQ